MKKQILRASLVIIVLLLSINCLKSQTYELFPDSNVFWIIEQDDGFGGNHYSGHYADGDTLIGLYTYTKVIDWGYGGAYRSDTNGITYYIPAADSVEYVIRDFSKNTGDTIKDVFFGFPGDNYIIDFYVDSVNYIAVGPYLLKRIYVDDFYSTLDSLFPFYYPTSQLIWIEKIGCTDGGFYNNIAMGLGGSWLYCMKHDDTVYYSDYTPSYTYGKCVTPIALEELSQVDSKIKIYPNPTESKINIKFSNPVNEELLIELMDVKGKIIYSKEVLNSTILQLDLSSYTKGVYLVRVKGKNIIHVEKVIYY